MSVRLHIDRLVLDGVTVSAADRPRLQAAVEQELARLVGAGGLSPEIAAGVAVPSLPAPPIALAPDARTLGSAIAASVYASCGSAAGEKV